MKAIISLMLLLALFAVMAAVIKTLKRGQIKGDDNWKVSAKKQLLNIQEQVVFHRLTEAFPEHIVLAQVALSQLIIVGRASNRTTVKNKIEKKVIDFVLCKPDTSVVAVYELDGKTHTEPEQQRRDKDKNKALESAGIHLFRMNANKLKSGAQLRADIDALKTE